MEHDNGFRTRCTTLAAGNSVADYNLTRAVLASLVTLNTKGEYKGYPISKAAGVRDGASGESDDRRARPSISAEAAITMSTQRQRYPVSRLRSSRTIRIGYHPSFLNALEGTEKEKRREKKRKDQQSQEQSNNERVACEALCLPRHREEQRWQSHARTGSHARIVSLVKTVKI